MLCATSLQAVHSDGLHDLDSEQPTQNGLELSTRIQADFVEILKLVHKDAVGLSLALRPARGSSSEEPLAGLDDASMRAAIALLNDLATDAVPKLVFLANLAHQHRAVVRQADSTEHDPVAQLAKSMGGQVFFDRPMHGNKDTEASCGELFARELRIAAGQVVELVAQLCQSFMNPRTRDVLAGAQQRRDGGVGPKRSDMPPHTRATALSLTKQLWELCDALSGAGPEATSATLARSNREALQKLWKQSALVLQDGLAELHDAIEAQGNESEQPAVDEDDIAAQWNAAVQLSEDEAESVRRGLALLEHGDALQRAAYRVLCEAESRADLDVAGEAVNALVTCQDELAASLLYGESVSDDESAADTASHGGPQATDAAEADDEDTMEQGDAIKLAAAQYAAACEQLKQVASDEAVDAEFARVRSAVDSL